MLGILAEEPSIEHLLALFVGSVPHLHPDRFPEGHPKAAHFHQVFHGLEISLCHFLRVFQVLEGCDMAS